MINVHLKLKINTIVFRIKDVPQYVTTSERKKLLRTSEASQVLINEQTFKKGHKKWQKNSIGFGIRKYNKMSSRVRKKSDNERAKQMKFLSMNKLSTMITKIPLIGFRIKKNSTQPLIYAIIDYNCSNIYNIILSDIVHNLLFDNIMLSDNITLITLCSLVTGAGLCWVDVSQA